MSGGGEGLQHIEIQQIRFLLVAGFLDTALMAYIFIQQRSCGESIVCKPYGLPLYLSFIVLDFKNVALIK